MLGAPLDKLAVVHIPVMAEMIDGSDKITNGGRQKKELVAGAGGRFMQTIFIPCGITILMPRRASETAAGLHRGLMDTYE